MRVGGVGVNRRARRELEAAAPLRRLAFSIRARGGCAASSLAGRARAVTQSLPLLLCASAPESSSGAPPLQRAPAPCRGGGGGI